MNRQVNLITPSYVLPQEWSRVLNNAYNAQRLNIHCLVDVDLQCDTPLPSLSVGSKRYADSVIPTFSLFNCIVPHGHCHRRMIKASWQLSQDETLPLFPMEIILLVLQPYGYHFSSGLSPPTFPLTPLEYTV